jgi:endonuclease IV
VEHYFGAHTIDTGGIHMAVRRAGNADMRAMQLFTAIPKYYGDRVSIRPERVTRFKEALAATKIAPERVVVHAAYVLNVATPDETKWSRARDGLARELERSTALGVGAVCFHPGAATDDDREAAAERIAAAIVHALEGVKGDTRLLVENTAGAGNDSEGALGSNKDRHMLIGDGEIGAEAFGWLLADRRTRGVPLILETPQLNMDIGEDDDTPDPYDVQMMELLGRIG